jgi:hypothetical protein
MSPAFLQALPEKAQSYIHLDRGWKTLVETCSNAPSLLRNASQPGLHEQLTALCHGFDAIYNMLEGYLEVHKYILLSISSV